MVDESKPGMQCTEFDALLTETIDGTLSGERRLEFERHRAGCAACNTLFAEVTNGAAWLHEMVEAEPPAKLVSAILSATSAVPQPAAGVERRPSPWERLRRELGIVFAPVLTPRFGLSMGMAFFSITLVLNVAQIRIKDLTPHNLSHTFYSSQNKLMKYYQNTRVVYEIESRMRELRNSSDESERKQKGRRLEQNNNRTRERRSEPQQREEQQFSREQDRPALALLTGSQQDSHRNWKADPETRPETLAGQRREL